MKRQNKHWLNIHLNGLTYPTHLCVRRRQASPPVDSHQGIFTKRHIKFEVHGVVDKDLRPPEDSRRDQLGDFAAHVYLAHVYEAVLREKAI